MKATMKRKIIACILLIALFCTVLPGCGKPPEYNVEITCLDETGEAVPGAEIILSTEERTDTYVSDENGKVNVVISGKDCEAELYSVPDEYAVISDDYAELGKNNLTHEFTVHKYTNKEIEVENIEQKYPTYTFNPVEFSTEDFNGNPVDSSIFSNADLTWIKFYCYEKGHNEEDLIVTKQLYDKYKDKGLQVLLVVYNMLATPTFEEADELAKATGTDFTMIPLCDELKPLCSAQRYVQNAFVDSQGRTILPLPADSEELIVKEDEIKKDKRYALSHFPEYSQREDETLPGKYPKDEMEKLLCILFNDSDRIYDLQLEQYEREFRLKDLGSAYFSSEDRFGKEYDESMFKDYKLTMINFWEPKGDYSVRELAYLQQLHTELKDQGFQVLGVYSDKNGDGILQSMGITFPNIYRTRSFGKFITGYVPTTVFVDSEGNTIALNKEKHDEYPKLSEELLKVVIIGENNYDGWKEVIQKYLESEG